MKWFTYTAAAVATMIVITNLLDQGSALHAVMDSLTGLVFGGMPVAVGIAVLRYRLYDIDVIINRTLVYAPLTVVLAAAYAGSVVSLQAVLRALTGQESTLAIAALFAPLRRRVQGVVDRRFYRRKYDTTRTLEGFSAKLRDETDLDALNDELVRVVRETMQPAHAGLWLRSEADPKAKRAD